MLFQINNTNECLILEILTTSECIAGFFPTEKHKKKMVPFLEKFLTQKKKKPLNKKKKKKDGVITTRTTIQQLQKKKKKKQKAMNSTKQLKSRNGKMVAEKWSNEERTNTQCKRQAKREEGKHGMRLSPPKMHFKREGKEESLEDDLQSFFQYLEEREPTSSQTMSTLTHAKPTFPVRKRRNDDIEISSFEYLQYPELGVFSQSCQMRGDVPANKNTDTNVSLLTPVNFSPNHLLAHEDTSHSWKE
ncbi:hypothetical protein RFI_03243 [Reticulomyxa filosa]|uniref:Uncharacterized protein n=1 Tax=Reticulomyxa filosa TaxID=46433 RepID=X6P6W2_RETFI|nr:hypothetical protein RFI_03243 [Reticulomyxa filosa]|eukprot:ETO33853.1 hypothetical protein RFI_03243 [Reticulomyxa filosa]